MRKSVLFTTLLLLNLQRIVSAQDEPVAGSFGVNQPLQIGVRLNGFTNFMHWQTSEFIDFRYQLRPFLSGAAGIILREPIANRLSLEGGLSIIQLGMSSSEGGNYRPNQRMTAKSSSRGKYIMFVVPVHLLYRLNRHKTTADKYLLLGANVYYNDTDDTNRFALITSTHVDIDTKDTMQVSERRRSPTKFGPAVVIGAGWQKRWSKRSAVDVRLTGSIGIVPLVQTFLSVTVRNQRRYYAPYGSTNELVNRGTYVGVDLCYLFSLR